MFRFVQCVLEIFVILVDGLESSCALTNSTQVNVTNGTIFRQSFSPVPISFSLGICLYPVYFSIFYHCRFITNKSVCSMKHCVDICTLYMYSFRKIFVYLSLGIAFYCLWLMKYINVSLKVRGIVCLLPRASVILPLERNIGYHLVSKYIIIRASPLYQSMFFMHQFDFKTYSISQFISFLSLSLTLFSKNLCINSFYWSLRHALNQLKLKLKIIFGIQGQLFGTK